MVFEPVCISGQNPRPAIVAERQPGRLGPMGFNFSAAKAARFSRNHSVHPFVTCSIFVLFSYQSRFYRPLDNLIVRFLKSPLNGLYAFSLHPVIGGCHRNRCRHFNQPADDALPQPVYQVGGTVVAGNDRRQLCFVPSVDEYEELLAYPVAWLFAAQVVQDQYVYGPGAIDNGLGGSGGIRIVIPPADALQQVRRNYKHGRHPLAVHSVYDGRCQMCLSAAVPAMDAQSPAMRLIAPAKILTCLIGHLGSWNLPKGLESPVLKPPPYTRLVRQSVDAPLLQIRPPFGALPGSQYVSTVIIVNADAYAFCGLLPDPRAMLAFLPLLDGIKDICC